jgi:G3E family GTPase
MNPKPHFILVGGFLGAGKTTAVARLARYLGDQGLRAGLITNDQGRDLVDTAILRADGHATEEIAGGCFCCRFDALVAATGRLCQTWNPDVLVAEAVGSCTDLVATVLRPLQRIHGGDFTIAPVSVLVDPLQARRVLGLDEGNSFSSEVTYLYRKQLEEADIIVINKSDAVPARSLDELGLRLQSDFPAALRMEVSAREGFGLHAWFNHVLFHERSDRPSIALDYDRYAAGEERLGWFNAVVDVRGVREFDADVGLLELAAGGQTALRTRAVEVAHLKLSLQSETLPAERIASVNLVRGDSSPEVGARCGALISCGKLLINLRAEGAADGLEAAMNEAIASWASPRNLVVRTERVDCFHPGRPNPTHRDGDANLVQ